MVIFCTLFLSSENGANKKGVRVPILMYHSVIENYEGKNPSIVSEEKFIEDMTALKKAGYTSIFIKNLYDYLKYGEKLPEKPVIITFDDGYLNNYDFVFPYIKASGINITIFPIGWSIGKSKTPSNQMINPHFDVAQMREMKNSGWVDFQSHTFDLHNEKGKSDYFNHPCGKGVKPLTDENLSQYFQRLGDDSLAVDYTFDHSLGGKPSFIAYPFGTYTKYSEFFFKFKGYLGSLSIKNGIRYYDEVRDLWGMPRINVSEELSSEELLKRIERH